MKFCFLEFCLELLEAVDPARPLPNQPGRLGTGQVGFLGEQSGPAV